MACTRSSTTLGEPGEKAKIVALVLPFPAIVLEVRRGLVLFVLAEFYFFADVRVKRADERATDGRVLRVIVCGFSNQVVSWTGKARVQAAGSQSAVALQFLHKLTQTHA